MNHDTMKRAIQKVQAHCNRNEVQVLFCSGGAIFERDINGNCAHEHTAKALATIVAQGHERRLLAELAKWARAALNGECIESKPIGDILADVDAVLAAEGESCSLNS